MIHHGDLFNVLPMLAEASIDACVTDPPYGIGFMGREWDTFNPTKAVASKKHAITVGERGRRDINPNTRGRRQSPAMSPSQIEYDRSLGGQRVFQEWTERWGREVLRVLKPGALIVVCGAPRSYHRMASGLEDAGFVVRDSFAWLFLSGFPKSHNFGCKCGGNPLQYSHEDGDPGHDSVRGVRQRSNDAEVVAEASQETDLFPSVQRGSAWAGLEEACPQGPSGVDGSERGVVQREDVGREQPGLEWRDIPRAGKGLPNDPHAGPSSGTGERLRAGAHLGSGEDPQAVVEAERGSASSGSRPSEQRTGQSANLRLPSRTLDDRASNRSARCARCGGLTEARGVGTAVKPAYEPICLAWKPFKGTITDNYIKYGTGALNIEACRTGDVDTRSVKLAGRGHFPHEDDAWIPKAVQVGSEFGRWPANLLLESADVHAEIAPYLYCAKPSREERDYGCNGLALKSGGERSGRVDGSAGIGPRSGAQGSARNFHPTVKPVELMRWLVKLVTPPGGVVLDPFTGSGTTGMACRYEQRQFIGIEKEADYVQIAERRIAAVAPLFSEAV